MLYRVMHRHLTHLTWQMTESEQGPPNHADKRTQDATIRQPGVLGPAWLSGIRAYESFDTRERFILTGWG